MGDEGGFAPDLRSNEEAIEVVLEAVAKTGYQTGKQLFLALDVAASEIFDAGKGVYRLESEDRELTSDEMVEYYSDLVSKYPIISIEDGLSEDDWAGWGLLNRLLGEKIQIVGDDLTVTNVVRLQRAIEERAMNAILIKLNQIGTMNRNDRSYPHRARKWYGSSNLAQVGRDRRYNHFGFQRCHRCWSDQEWIGFTDRQDM